jgi:MOSC domain-containing protein YiiM
VINTVKDDTSAHASSAKQGADLDKHLKQRQKYGKSHVRVLENGKIRYYDHINPATKPGDMVGSRRVREWNPKKDKKRTWFETIDQNNKVRQIREQVPEKTKTHYRFDEYGKYIGSW